MDFSDVINALDQASAFELFRLQSAIRRKLGDASWTTAIVQGLHVGQVIEYFCAQENAIRRARIIELRRKSAAVTDITDNRNSLIDYACINVDGIDVQVREQKQKGIGRNEVRVGDTLGFIDRDGFERCGKVTRLNDKTVSLLVDGRQWRVSYGLLHHVLNDMGSNTIEMLSMSNRVNGRAD